MTLTHEYNQGEVHTTLTKRTPGSSIAITSLNKLLPIAIISASGSHVFALGVFYLMAWGTCPNPTSRSNKAAPCQR